MTGRPRYIDVFIERTKDLSVVGQQTMRTPLTALLLLTVNVSTVGTSHYKETNECDITIPHLSCSSVCWTVFRQYLSLGTGARLSQGCGFGKFGWRKHPLLFAFAYTVVAADGFAQKE